MFTEIESNLEHIRIIEYCLLLLTSYMLSLISEYFLVIAILILKIHSTRIEVTQLT